VSMTDSVADMLTRIRNANTMRYRVVDVPASNLKEDILKAMWREGYIEGVERVASQPVDLLRVSLKYADRDEPVVSALKRTSRPGRRVYVGVNDLPKVMNGLGIAVLSTSKGVLTDRECRREKVGGEILCYVW